MALSGWARTIAYCEIDPYCQKVLLSRMADGSLDNAPIWDNINTLQGGQFTGLVDIIFGGFPCQDISVAGNGKGLAGERSGLFYQIVRLCREIKPRFIFLENVPAITTRGGTEVVREIAAMGYDCRWIIISAASVGALHRRDRWFLLAHAINDGKSTSESWRSVRECVASGKRQEEQEKGFGETERASYISSYSSFACNSDSQPGEQTHKVTKPKQRERGTWRGSTRQHWLFESREHWQKTVSEMGKHSDGVSNHVAKLRALGNSVVPAQCREAFKILMGLK